MKLSIIVLFLFFSTDGLWAQTEIEIKPNQSMSLIGKGPGQDSVINPYAGSKSAAVIQNMGEKSFEIRIQVKGEIVKTLVIKPGETEEIYLKKGFELYMDGDATSRSKALIDFRKISN